MLLQRYCCINVHGVIVIIIITLDQQLMVEIRIHLVDWWQFFAVAREGLSDGDPLLGRIVDF
jgi:hypothetical protein